MITPKSPEEIIASLETHAKELACKTGTALCYNTGWLRSSMASLLLHMAERLPGCYLREDCNEMHCCSEEHDEPRVMYCHQYNDAVQECTSILTNEAKKLTNNE